MLFCNERINLYFGIETRAKSSQLEVAASNEITRIIILLAVVCFAGSISTSLVFSHIAGVVYFMTYVSILVLLLILLHSKELYVCRSDWTGLVEHSQQRLQYVVFEMEFRARFLLV